MARIGSGTGANASLRQDVVRSVLRKLQEDAGGAQVDATTLDSLSQRFTFENPLLISQRWFAKLAERDAAFASNSASAAQPAEQQDSAGFTQPPGADTQQHNTSKPAGATGLPVSDDDDDDDDDDVSGGSGGGGVGGASLTSNVPWSTAPHATGLPASNDDDDYHGEGAAGAVPPRQKVDQPNTAAPGPACVAPHALPVRPVHEVAANQKARRMAKADGTRYANEKGSGMDPSKRDFVVPDDDADDGPLGSSAGEEEMENFWEDEDEEEGEDDGGAGSADEHDHAPNNNNMSTLFARNDHTNNGAVSGRRQTELQGKHAECKRHGPGLPGGLPPQAGVTSLGDAPESGQVSTSLSDVERQYYGNNANESNQGADDAVEEALGPADDDEETYAEPDTSNNMLAQLVTKEKSAGKDRYRCQLKNGLCTFNGNDYVFASAQVDLVWR